MFIVVRKSKGESYVELAEGYRNAEGKSRRRFVKYLGKLSELTKDDPNAIEKLRKKFADERMAKKRTASLGFKQETDKFTDDILAEGLRSRSVTLNYGYYVLRKAWNDILGLDRKLNDLQKRKTRCKFDLDATVSFLSFMKVLDPQSICGSFMDRYGFLGNPAENVTRDGCYDSYGLLKEHKDGIMKWINRQMDKEYGDKRASLVLYDVTNVYFETSMTDAEKGYQQADFEEQLLEMVDKAKVEGKLTDSCFDENGQVIMDNLPEWFLNDVTGKKTEYLCMRGPSKEHRYDLPLVSVVLVLDANGFPMDFEVFSGNTSEFKTMMPTIKGLMNKHGIKNAVIVAGRGLNSAENLASLKELGLGFLVAQKVTRFSPKLTKQILDLSAYSPINPENPETGLCQVLPWSKRRSGKPDVPCKLVLTWDERRKKRDEAVLDLWVQIVERRQAAGEKLGPRKTGWASLAKTKEAIESPIIGIKEEVFQRKKALCGFAAMVYAAPDPKDDAAGGKNIRPGAPELDGAAIASLYHLLNKIEDRFRLMKSNLRLRPMYVWNSDHVRGHVQVCTIALLLILLVRDKILKNGNQMSIDCICRTLASANVTVTSVGGKLIFTPVTSPKRFGQEYGCLNTEQLLKLIREHGVQTDPMDQIMEAMGLTPLPAICDKDRLARCLGTRFDSEKSAVSEVLLEAFGLRTTNSIT